MPAPRSTTTSRAPSCSTGAIAGGATVNKFLMSLNDAANRSAFGPTRRATSTGSDSTRPSAGGAGRDWLGLLEVGGNVYYTYKLAACDGLTFQDLAGHQTGMTATSSRR